MNPRFHHLVKPEFRDLLFTWNYEGNGTELFVPQWGDRRSEMWANALIFEKRPVDKPEVNSIVDLKDSPTIIDDGNRNLIRRLLDGLGRPRGPENETLREGLITIGWVITRRPLNERYRPDNPFNYRIYIGQKMAPGIVSNPSTPPAYHADYHSTASKIERFALAAQGEGYEHELSFIVKRRPDKNGIPRDIEGAGSPSKKELQEVTNFIEHKAGRIMTSGPEFRCAGNLITAELIPIQDVLNIPTEEMMEAWIEDIDPRKYIAPEARVFFREGNTHGRVVIVETHRVYLQWEDRPGGQWVNKKDIDKERPTDPTSLESSSSRNLR